MNLKNLFSKKTPPPSPAIADYEQAAQHRETGDSQAFFQSLAAGFEADITYRPLYELANSFLAESGAVEEATHFQQALNNFGTFESYAVLGNYFTSSAVYHLGILFLQKAHEIHPTDPEVAHNLAICLSRRFRIPEAINAIEQIIPSGDFWDSWYWLHLRTLNEDTDGIRENLQDLREALDAVEDQEQVVTPRQKLDELEGMLDRYEAVGKPAAHIRDWHFIQYGAVILHFAEADEGPDDSGRFVALWGSNEMTSGVLTKLKMVLQELGTYPERILFLPSRDSEIVGRAVAQALSLPALPYDPELATDDDLLVAADSSELNPHEELMTVADGPLTFALHHAWMESALISPDFIGLTAQSYYMSWNGQGMRVNENNEVVKIPADERPAATIANDIVNTPIKIEDFEPTLAFYSEHRQYLQIHQPHRPNFHIESPIATSYFGR